MFKFFSFFPTANYTFVTGGNPKLITNILHRIKIRATVKNNISLFTKLIIQDGETPESLSDKFYGDSGFHWIILLMNDITNPYYDWPLTIFDLRAFITEKYGSGNENATHHWEDSNQNEVNSVEPGALIVTNAEFEDKENEKRREVLILDSEFVPDFIKEYKDIIK